MAEDQDDSQKTEEPSQKKIDEAYKRGQVPVSREVGSFMMLLVFTLFMTAVMPWMMERTQLSLGGYIHSPDLLPMDGGFLLHHFINLIIEIAGLLMLVFIATIAAAIFSSFVQNGFNVSTDPLTPKLEKISLIKGFSRLFSLKSFVEFLKGILKITAIGYIAYKLLLPHLVGIEMLPTFDLKGMLAFLMAISTRLLMWACILMFAVAAIDIVYQRFEFFKSLRMSRQEMKDEYKETQGDPTIKARLRQLRQERARKRMMAAVPSADVVITNPEHFAVALQYAEGMAAPKVVAKGADLIALKIREIATAHNIPIVQNPPLARALHEHVEIEDEIPVKYYQAVAEVISYVMKLKKPQLSRSGL